MIKLRSDFISIGIALISILIASLMLSFFTDNFTYLKFDESTNIYITTNGREYDGERTIEDEISTLPVFENPIEVRIKYGTLIEVTTQKLSGDIDVDIAIQIIYNSSYSIITAYSIEVGSSNEHIVWQNKMKTTTAGFLDLLPSQEPSPIARILILSVEGSGMINFSYKILQPSVEFFYISIATMVIGTISLLGKLPTIINFINRRN